MIHELPISPERSAAPVRRSLLGLVVGSFANVCIHRIPLRRVGGAPALALSGAAARSIRACDNVPVLELALLRGRCRACRAPISPRYPAVEAANGLLWLALAVLRGPRPATLVAMALVTALLVLSLIDLDHHLLPDVITLPGIAAGPRRELPARLGRCRRSRPSLAAAGGYLAFCRRGQALRADPRRWKASARATGRWRPCSARSSAGRGCSSVLLASLAGTVVGLGSIALRGRDMRYALPLGHLPGRRRHRGRLLRRPGPRLVPAGSSVADCGRRLARLGAGAGGRGGRPRRGPVPAPGRALAPAAARARHAAIRAAVRRPARRSSRAPGGGRRAWNEAAAARRSRSASQPRSRCSTRRGASLFSRPP